MSAPSHIGGYEIVRLLSTGGMGELFLARRKGPAGFTTTVVLKRILRHLVHDASTVELFVREARIAALLSHANVVRTFELGQDGEDYFIIMEYVRGRSLRAVQSALKKAGRSLPIPVAVGICQQALRGLHHAHTITDEQGRRIGIVHRDVSPDNLLVGFDGVVKLADFGVAKAGLLSPETIPGTLKGKLAFAAPEQLLHQPLDARADLYSLGAVLYELLTGHLPFEAESERAYFVEGPTAAVKPAREWNPEIPAELDAVVLRALAKNPAERPETADALASALTDALGRAADFGEISTFLAELFPEGREAADSIAVEKGTAHPGTARGTVRGTVASAAQGDRSETQGFAPGDSSPTLSPGEGKKKTWFALAALALVVLGGAWGARRLSPLEDVRQDAGVLPIATPAVTAPEKPLADAIAPAKPLVDMAAPEPPPADVPASAKLPADVTASAKPHAHVTSPAKPPAVEPARAKSSPVRVPVVKAANEKPVPAKLEPARLSIRASPWAEVELDSRPLGSTPIAEVELTPGRHRLVLRNPDLKVERAIPLVLEPGERRVVKEDLREPR